jgi:hypothetical protein
LRACVKSIGDTGQGYEETSVIVTCTCCCVAVNASHKELCAQITCTRLQTCTVNIQGIPMCRCPSAIFCRQQRGRRQRPQGSGGLSGGPVCAMDGRTYRSRCFLRMKECTGNKRIKVQHDGACIKRKGAGGGGKRRERYEIDEDDYDEDGVKKNNGMERNRKDARRENRKLQRKTEKLLQRQLRQEEKKEKRREEQKSLKKQERREKKKAKKEDDVGLSRFEKKRDEGKKKRRERRRLRRRIASAKNKRGKKSRGRRSCDGNDLGLDTIDTIVI